MIVYQILHAFFLLKCIAETTYMAKKVLPLFDERCKLQEQRNQTLLETTDICASMK